MTTQFTRPNPASARSRKLPRTESPTSKAPVMTAVVTATPAAGHPNTAEHDLKLRRITSLTSSDHDGQRFLALLDSQVGLGGQPASGPAQSVIGRFDLHSAGVLFL